MSKESSLKEVRGCIGTVGLGMGMSSLEAIIEVRISGEDSRAGSVIVNALPKCQ